MNLEDAQAHGEASTGKYALASIEHLEDVLKNEAFYMAFNVLVKRNHAMTFLPTPIAPAHDVNTTIAPVRIRRNQQQPCIPTRQSYHKQTNPSCMSRTFGRKSLPMRTHARLTVVRVFTKHVMKAREERSRLGRGRPQQLQERLQHRTRDKATSTCVTKLI
jgi:hypothetical protein